jgi:orotate phosphoribosyltransferase
MNQARQDLRDHLLKHSVRRGEFTLKSGAKATYFIDAKQTAADPDGMLLVAECLLEMIPGDVDAIGGMTMGADPVAFGVAGVAATRGRKLKSFSVRKEAKGHGAGGRIAGSLAPGDRVVITEDCVTRGVSPIEAAEVVREFGAEVVLIAPIVDRGGSCEKLARDAGIDFQPILTAPDLELPYEGGL